MKNCVEGFPECAGMPDNSVTGLDKNEYMTLEMRDLVEFH